MKNRLFLIIIGLCFVSLVCVAFLRISRPKTEVTTQTGVGSRKCRINRYARKQWGKPPYRN